jgi:hypothetical protein
LARQNKLLVLGANKGKDVVLPPPINTFIFLFSLIIREPPVCRMVAARQTRPYFYSLFAMIGAMGP